ncbi:MAG: hypothetical protein FWD96_06820, partial [Defluviitaleaceae bacterium]|nr:hypothetical protein [Defluviitaleaceae bacterium]
MRVSSFYKGLRKVVALLRSIKKSRPRGRRSINRGMGRGSRVRIRGLRRTKPYAAHICAAVLIIVVVAVIAALISPTRRVNITPDVVAAFQIPQRNIITLRLLAERHALDFPEALAL